MSVTNQPAQNGAAQDEGSFRDLTAQIPRVALTRSEAAAALGMSLNTFERYVQPELPIIRLGRVRLIATEELQQWARAAGQRTLG